MEQQNADLDACLVLSTCTSAGSNEIEYIDDIHPHHISGFPTFQSICLECTTQNRGGFLNWG